MSLLLQCPPQAPQRVTSDCCPVDECSQRIIVTTRLLLRCMWNCLILNQKKSELAQRMMTDRISVGTGKGKTRGSPPPSQTASSRSVYREVLLKQQEERRSCAAMHAPRRSSGTITGASSSGNHQGGDSADSMFSSSISFTLLRSTLTMSLALLFLRRAQKLSVTRRQQFGIGQRFHGSRITRRTFLSWRNTTRVAWRWRRWVLRRCVDHWWQFAQRRVETRKVIHRFLAGIRERMNAFQMVTYSRSQKILRHWNRRWTQCVVERQLTLRCAQFCTLKQVTVPTYAVRKELHECGDSADIDHSVVRLPFGWIQASGPSINDERSQLKQYCFRRWVRRAEERLDEYCARATWRRRCFSRCFHVWRSRCVLSADSASEAACAHSDPAHAGVAPTVVLLHKLASPTQTVYRLKGFLAAKGAVRRFDAFRRWKWRWHASLADRLYVHRLMSRAVTVWVDRTADRRIERSVKHHVFSHWCTKFLIRRQAAFASDLHRAVILQRTWLEWTDRAKTKSFARTAGVALGRCCLRVWKERTQSAGAIKLHKLRTLRSCVRKWFIRAASQRQHEMQELVAEALWQHITVTAVLRRWKGQYHSSVEERHQEQSVFDAVDDRCRDKLRQYCFSKWSEKLRRRVRVI